MLNLTTKKGIKIHFWIHLHAIVRKTEAAVWQAAEELIQHIDDETIALAQKIFSHMDLEGQKR